MNNIIFEHQLISSNYHQVTRSWVILLFAYACVALKRLPKTVRVLLTDTVGVSHLI